MAALQCEICGGKLIGRSGGLFECDSCGMEFDKEWVKEKIQEIKGTVKVEGTVEVQGTVKVDGPIEVKGGINIESLLKRGQLALEDQNWKDADQYFDEALNYDPECAEAYLGKLMASLKVKKQEDITNCQTSFEKSPNYMMFLRFAEGELKNKICGYAKQCFERCAQESKLFEQKESYKYGKNTMKQAGSSEEYQVAERYFRNAGDYRDAADCAKECHEKAIEVKEQEKLTRWQNTQRIAAGGNHTVGLCSDGTIVTSGRGYNNKPLSNLRNIVSVFASGTATFGFKLYENAKEIISFGDEEHLTIVLLKNGTISVNGSRRKVRQYESITKWSDIVAIAVGDSLKQAHVIGLRSNGTVVATGDNGLGQCNVAGWKNITAIAAGCMHTVGLCSNGTTVAVGSNSDGQCKNLSYKKVVAISAGKYHTVGLCADGTVAATGRNNHGQCNVSEWRDIVAIAAGDFHTVGLKRDGTVVAVGNNAHGQCNVKDWQLYSKEELAAQKLAELETKKAALESERVELPEEQAKLQAELPTLKGLFSGGRRKEVEARLAEIPTRLVEIDSELARLEEELAALG